MIQNELREFYFSIFNGVISIVYRDIVFPEMFKFIISDNYL